MTKRIIISYHNELYREIAQKLSAELHLPIGDDRATTVDYTLMVSEIGLALHAAQDGSFKPFLLNYLDPNSTRRYAIHR